MARWDPGSRCVRYGRFRIRWGLVSLPFCGLGGLLGGSRLTLGRFRSVSSGGRRSPAVCAAWWQKVQIAIILVRSTSFFASPKFLWLTFPPPRPTNKTPTGDHRVVGVPLLLSGRHLGLLPHPPPRTLLPKYGRRGGGSTLRLGRIGRPSCAAVRDAVRHLKAPTLDLPHTGLVEVSRQREADVYMLQ